jgi:hypothetical protein
MSYINKDEMQMNPEFNELGISNNFFQRRVSLICNNFLEWENKY